MVDGKHFAGLGCIYSDGPAAFLLALTGTASSVLQLIWLVRELVKSSVLGADGVCMTFMKQIAGESSTAHKCFSCDPHMGSRS